MSIRGDICREAAALIQDKGLACGSLYDPETGSYCLNGAFEQIDDSHLHHSSVARKLLDLRIAPEGRYWNPLDEGDDFIDQAGVEVHNGYCNAAGWSNACAWRGRPDEVIHGIKLVAEAFDLEDEA